MTAVSLDRLHYFAQYLEQNIVFGEHDDVIQWQMDTELKGVDQRLTKTQIRQITQQILAGSTHSVSGWEISRLYALQEQKDCYGTLRAIATNTDAVMRVLEHVQPGNRMIVMDMVKVEADESKLRAPDVFETNTYGQHRNGLMDNHAWNLQKLVRAIRDSGFQDRVMLVIRLDGPDAGANVNIFDANSQQRYELAIFKFIRYLETVLPTVPFKIVLGNEPDLFTERPWSDPSTDWRMFALNEFAPPMGAFMKRLARQRPDVTFMCPALSANLKHDYPGYYTAFFGDERPENLIPCMHGYSADVAAMPGGHRNLLERQAEALRAWGRFRHVSGTEIGSGNPFADCEALSDKGRFGDVIAWILLSTEHRTSPGQDNNWNFRVNPSIDDPTARHLSHVINRTQARVLRNVREGGGVGLQIMRGHIVDHPAYAVEYVDHNSPTTMVAGQTNAVGITIRNTSYCTWPASGPNRVRLGYHWYTSDGGEVPSSLWDDHRTSLPYDLRPDQSLSLNCNLSAPRAPGAYEVRWDVVEEMVTWFAWQGVPTLNIRVVVNADDAVSPPTPTGVSVSASHNNRQQGPDNLTQAIDNNPYTRWSTLQPQQPGMWFQIDLGEVRTVSQVRLNNAPSPRDYPRGYIVKVSRDGRSWTTVAESPFNDRPLNVAFNPCQVRYIRIEQTGSDPDFWWSIHEIDISDEVGMIASASHNNALVGADNVMQALDGCPETRWSTRALQSPGMWFEIDLNATRMVCGLALDTTHSPNDYPCGYIVRLSEDHDHWREVVRNDHNDRALDITFGRLPARYIRIEQIGSSDRWWWSIHEVTVKS
jgi:hypothetical protein